MYACMSVFMQFSADSSCSAFFYSTIQIEECIAQLAMQLPYSVFYYTVQFPILVLLLLLLLLFLLLLLLLFLLLLIDGGGWRGYTACPVCTLKRLVALSLLSLMSLLPVSSIPTAYPTPILSSLHCPISPLSSTLTCFSSKSSTMESGATIPTNNTSLRRL